MFSEITLSLLKGIVKATASFKFGRALMFVFELEKLYFKLLSHHRIMKNLLNLLKCYIFLTFRYLVAW